MNDPCFPAEPIRQAILEAAPLNTAQYGDSAPEPRFIYPPFSHASALDPNTVIVEGIRGSGKSLWWSALLSEKHRLTLSMSLPKAGIPKKLTVSNGFGAKTDVASAPPKDVLPHLIKQFHPREIWKAIIARQTFVDQSIFDERTWAERVLWVKENVEQYEHNFNSADRLLAEKKQIHLILFDALEHTADNWNDLRKMIRGLLQLALDVRSSQAIRCKIFVRPDMLEKEVTSFPDASKLLTSRAKLNWSRADLYGLLWQYLGNAHNNGETFRQSCQKDFGEEWELIDEVFRVPTKMRTDEDFQRKIFHAITGPWMGSDRKRGFPYTWLSNHLADAHGQASPRSFLTAIRTAAETPTPSGWAYALYYGSIHKGVQDASQLRVNEILEDYPWLDLVMSPLRGKVIVPCEFENIESIWVKDDILKKIENWAKKRLALPPSRLESGYIGINNDLEDLGVLQSMPDDRIQMPDLYRVAFGMGRKGGVRPLR
jgi:hypothetical protein